MKCREAGYLLLVLWLAIASGCAGETLTPFASAPAPLLPTSTAIVETSPAPTATATLSPTTTPATLNLNPQVIVLAEDFIEPDDLVLGPDGSIYISDVAQGTIKAYTPAGQLNQILSGLNAPEGMAFLPDGSLVIAEQGNNRLIRYDFPSRTLAPFLELVNHTDQLGVDGILWDGANLIVPDSPNGTVLEVSPDGRTVRQIASGLVRPTGAWLEPGGTLLIADEYGNAVFRLQRDGTLQKIADLPIPDDVIVDAQGNIFAVTLGDDAVHVLTAGQDIILVSGLDNPQGIIFDAGGNLIVTDSGHHRLLQVLIH